MKRQIRLLVESLFNKEFDDIYNIDLDTEIANHVLYNYFPETTKQLRTIIEQLLEERGPNADLNDIDTSKITDMNSLFYKLDIHNIDISGWNISNVNTMADMFLKCTNFTGECLENWDISNLIDMSQMFAYCTKFTGNAIENWNTQNIQTMDGLFFNCIKFNANLSNWNVRKVKNMKHMFFNCINFEGNGLENWKTTKVNNMCSMFHYCKNFNCNLSKWNVKHVRNFSWMFNGCLKFTGEGLENWEPKMAIFMYAMFTHCRKPSWWKKTSKPY